MGNITVWDGGLSPFYEVYYLTVNHPESGSAFWIRTTLLATQSPNPDRRAGLWLARFADESRGGNLALRTPISESDVHIKPGSFELEVADSHLREGHWDARFTAEGHEVSWSLDWTPNERALWLIPPLVRKLHLNKADVAVQNVDISVYGTIRIDDKEYKLSGSPAGQSHHWGRHYAKEWLWAHCNDFIERPGAWLEALTVKMLDAGPLRVPATMFAMHTGEREIAVRSTPQMFRAAGEYADGRWVWAVQDGDWRAEVELKADEERFVAFPYESPHNETYTCHNCCRTDATVRIFNRRFGRWRQTDELFAPSRAAAEFCTKDLTDPGHYRFRGMRPVGFLDRS